MRAATRDSAMPAPIPFPAPVVGPSALHPAHLSPRLSGPPEDVLSFLAGAAHFGCWRAWTVAYGPVVAGTRRRGGSWVGAIGVLAAGGALDPQHLIETVGLIGIFAIVFAESGLLVGFFLPGDSLLFTAGLLCATAATAPLHLSCPRCSSPPRSAR